MADPNHEQALDALLAHRDAVPEDAFVLGVMQRVQAERRRRRAILLGFGLAGGVFGVLGAAQLAEPVAAVFSGLSTTALMQAVLLACGATAFYVWFMNEDLGLAG